jgi:SAM-dependent methyltransferase
MTSSDQVLDLLDLPIRGAAVGAALELGLFWVLADGPRATESLGGSLGIPTARCGSFLALLEAEGLVDETDQGWTLTPMARSTIVGGYSMATWQFLAEEARERCEAVLDLPAALRAGATERPEVAGYVVEMLRDPGRARRFTRMLLEIHQPLARHLAAVLDLAGVRSLMDLGGGSGVVSLTLARRWPHLSATIVDVATVCDAGREIATEESLADRVSYLPADFLADPLPRGFDAILECDVAIYSASLFRKVREALAPQGRFFVVDAFAADRTDPEPRPALPADARQHSEVAWSLVRRLKDPEWEAPTVASTSTLLREAGFDTIMVTRLPALPGVGGVSETPTVLEAR